MTDYYKTTENKGSVDIPSWAQQFEVGDLINWQVDEVDGVKQSEIVGFSTLFDVGYPVIEPPREYIDGGTRAECVAVTEDSFVEVKHNE